MNLKKKTMKCAAGVLASVAMMGAVATPAFAEEPETYAVRISTLAGSTGNRVTYTPATYQLHMMKDAAGNDVSKTTDPALGIVNGIVTLNDGTNTYNRFKTASMTDASADGNTYASATDTLGTVTTPTNLPAGTYRLEKVSAPDGFYSQLFGSNQFEFTLNDSSVTGTTADGRKVVDVASRESRLTKQLWFTSQFEKKDGSTSFVSFIDDDDLTASYTVYAASDIIDPVTGYIEYSTGDVVIGENDFEIDTSNKAGIQHKADLGIGSYVLRQTSRGEGVSPVPDYQIEVKQEVKYTRDNYPRYPDTESALYFNGEKATTESYCKNMFIKNYTTVVVVQPDAQYQEAEEKFALLDANSNVIDTWTVRSEYGYHARVYEGLPYNGTYYVHVGEVAEGYKATDSDIKFAVEERIGTSYCQDIPVESPKKPIVIPTPGHSASPGGATVTVTKPSGSENNGPSIIIPDESGNSASIETEGTTNKVETSSETETTDKIDTTIKTDTTDMTATGETVKTPTASQNGSKNVVNTAVTGEGTNAEAGVFASLSLVAHALGAIMIGFSEKLNRE